MYSILNNNSVNGTNNSTVLLQVLSDESNITVDKRIHFMLNNGSISCPSKIYVIKPDNLDKVLIDATQLFLADSIQCDVRRWSITLPRICDIYRNDFGDDNISVLQQCKRLVEFSVQNEIQDVLNAAKHISSVVIKFHKPTLESRKNLEIIEL